MAKFVLCVHVVIWSVLDYPAIGPRPMSRYMYNHRLVSSVGRAPVCCAEGRGFEPQTAPTLRVLK